MDPDPAIFVIDLQDANKKIILFSFFAFYFLKVHLSFFKSQKEVTAVGIKVFLTIFAW
jgi:hypothetical protein